MNEVSLLRWSPADGTPDPAAVSARMAALGYTFTRYVYPPGASFPAHEHAFDKCSSVLAGRFEIAVGARAWMLAPGDLLFIPAGVIHTARVLGCTAVISLDGERRQRVRSTAPVPFDIVLQASGKLTAMLLLAALTVACRNTPPALAALSTDAVVLAFGDSLTYGSGAPRGQSYPDILAKLIERQVVNAGVPGELSAAGRRRLAALLDRVNPDLLILCHGGNDLLRGRSVELVRDNLTAMIALAQEREVRVLLLGVPPPGLILATADLYHEVARATGTPLDSAALPAVLGKGSLKADPVHPNAAGYRALAEHVRRALVAHGAL